MEADIRVRCLQAKDCPGWPAAPGAGREAWRRLSLRTSEGNQPC